jgi:hypothetical protein
MRRFMVHLVTEVEFEGWRRSIRQDSAELPEAAVGDRSERRPRALAPDSQGGPDRECLGRRNQG